MNDFDRASRFQVKSYPQAYLQWLIPRAARLPGDLLARALARVEKQDDLAILSRWFKQALTLSPEALVAELDK
jgi:hypothetical protein